MSNGMNLSKVFTVIVLLLAAVGIIYAVVSFNNQEDVVLEIGQPAPGFTLQGLDGKEIDLADYKGKVVMVNFWASWCEPCRIEMPEIQKAHETYKDQGLMVIGVNLRENEITVDGFAQTYGLTFPIALDPDGKVAVNSYKVKPLPTTFFIDREGILRSKAEMPMSYEFIEQTLKPLL